MNDAYAAIAEIYDGTTEAFCREIAAWLLEGAKRYGIAPGTRTIDLACGTGVVAVELQKAGFSVLGIDRSAAMLARARMRADRDAHTRSIALLEADMRSFSLPEPVGWIVSTHDSLNHLLDPADLERAVECAARALIRGGWFMFDTNVWEGTRTFDGQNAVLDLGSRFAVFRIHAKARRLTTEIIIFTKDASGAWHRSDARLEQAIHDDADIEARLGRTGFEIVEKQTVQEKDGVPTKRLFVCRR